MRYLTDFFGTNLTIHVVISLNLNYRISALVNRLILSLKINLIQNELNLLLVNFLAIQRNLRLKSMMFLVFLLLRIYFGNLLRFLKFHPFAVSPFEILDFMFLLDGIIYTCLRHRSIIRILIINLRLKGAYFIDLLL